MFKAKMRRIRGKITLISLAILVSFVISYFPNNYIPSWDKVFNFFDVSTVSTDISDYEMSVHFLNVGKADAIYINCNGKNVLIDAGDVDTQNTVYEYLKRNNVYDLDLVMVSHPHRDHIGQMPNIINSFNIKKFIMPKLPYTIAPTYKTYEYMLEALDDNNISIDEPIPGDSFMVGDMLVEIFAPLDVYEDVNNNSIVARITYGEDSFLFVGDAEKEAEKDLISSGYDFSADVLKVAHHGSKTSSTNSFLDMVSPEYAVISVGQDSNNLPKQSIIDRLTLKGIKIYRTDISGSIVFLTNGDGISVKTEK